MANQASTVIPPFLTVVTSRGIFLNTLFPFPFPPAGGKKVMQL